MDAYQADKATVELFSSARQRIFTELSKVITGQQAVVEQILLALFTGGNCLLTGAPGLAKTLLIKSLAQLFHLKFQRIQFTPDLMPADITGTEILQDTPSGRSLVFVRGPLFANIVLADEINRTPPKTQSALLEAMQEHQITAAGVRYPLEDPFFVLATQNPIEMEGTYPLPEAQLDRFMFNIVMDYPPEHEEVAIVKDTTQRKPSEIQPVFAGADLIRFHDVVRKVPVSDEVVRFAVRLAAASRPGQPAAPGFVNDYLSWGAGLRASQAMVLGAKARALLNSRPYVTKEDVQALAAPVLRHRLLLNYRAAADAVSVEKLIERLLAHVSGAAPSPQS